MLKYFLAILLSSLLVQCKRTSNNNEDASVANLPSVSICNQIWTSQNLSVQIYRNGDIIPQVTDSLQWIILTQVLGVSTIMTVSPMQLFTEDYIIGMPSMIQGA
jgi:hypothetical protein